MNALSSITTLYVCIYSNAQVLVQTFLHACSSCSILTSIVSIQANTVYVINSLCMYDCFTYVKGIT